MVKEKVLSNKQHHIEDINLVFILTAIAEFHDLQTCLKKSLKNKNTY